jgi:hypothetical protein
MTSSSRDKQTARREDVAEVVAALDAPTDESDVFDRPTIAPPFDLEAFAKAKMGDRDDRAAPSEMPTRPPPDDPASGTYDRPGSPSAEAPPSAPSSVSSVAAGMTEDALLRRLGSLEWVPTLAVDQNELRALAVDHRAAFLLSQVDGVSTIEMILDISGMPRADGLRFVIGFLEQGIIRLY